MVFMILMQPCLAAKVISTVSATVESDVIGLTHGGKLASSAIILPNGTAYDSYTDDGLLITSDFDMVLKQYIRERLVVSSQENDDRSKIDDRG